MNHLEFAAMESAALEETPWEKWCSKVEQILGHDLDGDDDVDGYSLDDAFAIYERGDKPEKYAKVVLRATHRCVRCGEQDKHGMRHHYCSECREQKSR